MTYEEIRQQAREELLAEQRAIRAAWARKWRKKNADKVKANNRRYYEKRKAKKEKENAE